ncbi:MAG: malto-oligosyltrehalose synthase [Thiohalobacteraceae bacterium]
MAASESLDRLCESYGIATEYRDIHGARHEVTPDTKRALLTAMGVACSTDAELQQAWEERAARHWQRWLPPVSVQREGRGPQIVLSLPEHQASATLHWTLTLESGAQHSGELHPETLTAVDRVLLGGVAYRRYAFALPATLAGALPLGYHRFELRADDVRAEQSLIIVPERCYQPEAILGERRVWGFAVQLYALRTQRQWGIGDFSDLTQLVERAAEFGADVVGVSPLHALFPANPLHASPYSPSSRLFLNLLLLDLEAIEEFAACAATQAASNDAAFQAHLRGLRSEERIQYAQVAELKLDLLERLYECFRERHLANDDARAQAFRAFCAERGPTLRNQARFDALQEHFRDQGRLGGWPGWPAAFQDPAAPAVAAFAEQAAVRVEFFAWLYWQAELQLATAGRTALERRLGIGLYLDVALSSDHGGAEVWANPALYALDAEIGSPPDDFNLRGQNWGLPPMRPDKLFESGYACFIGLLRENMRHAGAIRLDHVMALQRLFWIPAGRTPEAGSYVAYPLEDLLGILALESQRNACLVVGEDLGTVPEGLSERLAAAGVLSYRVFYFEKDDAGAFVPPAAYPSQALVTVSTHDLPTLTGFWQGADLELRGRLSLFPAEEIRQTQILQRAEDRTRLLMALEQQALLPEGLSPVSATGAELNAELIRAVHLFLARTPAKLLLVRLEDLLEQLQQINLPGTTGQYPNWQYKLPLALEDWVQDSRVCAVAEALHAERVGAVTAAPEAAPIALQRPLRIPRATYRLQFHGDFRFEQATALVAYFARLGISHCYASPFLKARPGSLHGYDVVDHSALNPEIGTPEDFDRFADALRAADMGLIIDTVPNHMAVMGSDNAWWLDVLENGPVSIYAAYFDIDWDTRHAAAGHKLLLPVLGDHYGRVLDSGDLRLAFEAETGAFSILYFEHRFPIDPREYPRILGHRLELLGTRLSAEDPQLLAFQALVTAFGHLPARDEPRPERVAERQRDKEVYKSQLARLQGDNPIIAAFIAANVAEINGDEGAGHGVDRLHALIAAQSYRLAYWRVASDEINYRRFFDINDLAALRMENNAVFEAAHRLIFELLAAGKVDGLRIDHPDGLYDPVGYFTRLQQRFGAGEADSPLALYVVVEKILADHENLPEHWPVHGTTGYEFGNLVNGLFVAADSADKLQRTYRSFTDVRADFEEIVYRAKIGIMRGALASELNVLANQASRIAQADRYTCDYTLNNLRRALTEVVACFPVYRSYVTEEGASPHDLRYIDWAVSKAKKRSWDADVSVFDFLHDLLSARVADDKLPDYRASVVAFARKFQQYSAPVMAKGLEDTSFYIYNRLVSLNEVGGDPQRYGTSVEAFHRANEARCKYWPHAMLGTSTHDSKRSEDVRTRIDLLSEMPDAWRRVLSRWHRFNRSRTRHLEQRELPSRNDQYLFYQTLIGVWPFAEQDDDGATLAALCDRVDAYMLKAIREAKVETSWINPNPEYEEAVSQFVRGVLAPRNSKFLADLRGFHRPIAWFGALNSLSQLVLKFCAPGVPDTYQGTELWDFSLVDPDNRRPVDYQRRQAVLDELIGMDALEDSAFDERLRGLLENLQDGRIKLYLLWKILSLRRDAEALFRDGDYLPLSCVGTQAEHLCAFARRQGESLVAVVVPRLCFRLLQGNIALPVGRAVWTDSFVELPLSTSNWVNLLTRGSVAATPGDTGVRIPAADLFATMPFALLVPSDAGR